MVGDPPEWRRHGRRCPGCELKRRQRYVKFCQELLNFQKESGAAVLIEVNINSPEYRKLSRLCADPDVIYVKDQSTRELWANHLGCAEALANSTLVSAGVDAALST